MGWRFAFAFALAFALAFQMGDQSPKGDALLDRSASTEQKGARQA